MAKFLGTDEYIAKIVIDSSKIKS